jgi:DNA polymerase
VVSSLAAVAAEAASCRACPLWRDATQTVFGEGPAPARLMLVGEQPGDREDVEGSPFVGPAGRILTDALAAAGLKREDIYVTNAVKHFKWTPRGKRRIHQKPNSEEIAACHQWLDAELALVRPEMLVAMGATAAGALLGPGVKVTKQRGELITSPLAPMVTVTVHPSSILRAGDGSAREAAFSAFVADLEMVARALG